MIAILEKKVELSLAGQDIFLNVAGGVRLDEPAVDLAAIAALASSHLNRVINPKFVLFGEVGLTGEVRAVSQPELRVKEAARLGFYSLRASRRQSEKHRCSRLDRIDRHQARQ